MTTTVAAKLNLKLWQLNFVGAYLNSLTKEDIYMKQCEGFIKPRYKDYVCKLIHTIYGTMQGGHDWYKKLSQMYNELGYITSWVDLCIWFKKKNGNYTIIDTYTNDTSGASSSDEKIKRRKDETGGVWKAKDVGETEDFLGMRVEQDLELKTIRLTQHPYWEHILNKFSLTNVTPRNTPPTHWNRPGCQHVSQNWLWEEEDRW
jgi:Reverse transcriptase (RNA-dependent DNA polymerase)